MCLPVNLLWSIAAIITLLKYVFSSVKCTDLLQYATNTFVTDYYLSIAGKENSIHCWKCEELVNLCSCLIITFSFIIRKFSVSFPHIYKFLDLLFKLF
jgi:hypothetical protein